MLSIRLLGPVSAGVGERPVLLSGRLGRTTLAVLALEPGQIAPPERLVDACWGESPPATAIKQLHNQVSRLRRAFREAGASADVVQTDLSGYRLAVDAECVDLARVRRLRALAKADRARGEPAAAVERLRAARAAWHGTPLGGVSQHLAATARGMVEELWLTVVEEWATAELECGGGEQLALQLGELVREHPLSEPLHRLRMLALYRCGRRTEALAAFRQARDVLRDELGLDPPAGLRELERRIFADGGDGADGDGAAEAPVVSGRPAQLPPVPAGFVGRSPELAAVRELLTTPTADGAPRIALLSGMAGVGKTAIAVRATTAAANTFPDGQLYVDLLGDREQPLDPFLALGGFLQALGVEGRWQPPDLAGRSAALRTRTAGRSVVLVLDNAADEAQVEPLLPADPRCAVVVTSRSRLPGLAASLRLPVAPVPDEVAAEMLAAAATGRALDLRSAEVTTVVRVCAGLPLALRVAGARLAAARELSVGALAAELTVSDPLDGLTAGSKSMRASLEAGFATLTGRQRAAIHALAGLPVGQVRSWVLAPLLDVDPLEADRTMRALAERHLVEPADVHGATVGYRFHDLVRAHARATAPPRDDDALLRLAGWASALARAVDEASDAVDVLRDVGELPAAAPPAGFTAEAARDPRGWVVANWALVLAAFDSMLHIGRTTVAAALLRSLRDWLIRLDLFDECAGAADRLHAAAGSDPWARAVAVQTTGLVAFQRSQFPDVVRRSEELIAELTAGASATDGDEDPATRWPVDPVTATDILLLRGTALQMSDELDAAESVLRRAERLAVAIDDPLRWYRAHLSLAEIRRAGGRLAEALRHGRHALRVVDRAANAKERALTRFAVARMLLELGRVGPARQLIAAAVELTRRSGDLVGQSWCLVGSADAARIAGDTDAAVRAATEAITLARRLRRPDAEAAAEQELAKALAAGGDLAAARAAAGRAMRLCLEFDSPIERRYVLALLRDLHRPAEIGEVHT